MVALRGLLELAELPHGRGPAMGSTTRGSTRDSTTSSAAGCDGPGREPSGALPPPGAAGGDPEHFDEALEARVRAFQQRRGLVADGIVGRQTARVLDAARWRLGDRILMFTPGHLIRGDDVAALQERLAVLGVLPAPVDGIFGVQTEAGLRELQRGLGVEPDGVCGPATLRALDTLARAVGGGDPWALREEAHVAGAGPSLAGKVVLLDPAHGAGDPGATGYGLTEADVALDLARRIQGRLATTAARAVLTRSVATCPSDEERAATAVQAGADLLLSLHCDAHASPLAAGVSTFYWGDARVGARSATGSHLAELVQREVVARTRLVDLRTHPCTFDILRLTPMPAVQLELGYLTNEQDARRLADGTFRDVVAEAVVVAIQRLYLSEQDPATGTMRLRDVLAHAGLA